MFRRSGTRHWPLPPIIYRQSTIPVAMTRLNEVFLPNIFHNMPNGSNNSSTTIFDQLLIRVTKEKDTVQSPTPEGIHQDGTELSSVTLIGLTNVTQLGEIRLWPILTPMGNYKDHLFESSTCTYRKTTCLVRIPLHSKWDTIMFNDRMVKHETRPFDGNRPAFRDVIVNFIRKPLVDGSDKKLENGGIISIQ